MDGSFLHLLNQYPLAGAMLIAMLLIIQQIVRVWKGKNDVTRIESETNKLARQTSETVNLCSSRTQEVMDRLDEFIQTNDIGHVSTEVKHAVSLLVALAKDQELHKRTLDRIDELCHDIDRDIRGSSSRVEHTQILGKLDALEKELSRLR